ncbi:MAG TPA: haloacid dehalogenase type II [Chthoniobacterales bacterium]|nr:haloacid dehalogenase type II [Chthoniobacterales bacterium]
MFRANDLKALLFDVFGTVVDWRSSLIDAFSRFGQSRQLAADWAQLADQWRAAYWPSMDNVRKGELAWTTLDELHRAALIKLLPVFGLEQLSENDLDYLNAFWHRLNPWPDACPGLARLKTRFLIGPLSNGNFSLMVELNKFAGLGWDFVLGSDIFHHYKPDPEVYLGACSLLGLAPAQVMMVAAHNYDLHAARSFGLHTAFIPRPTEHGPSQTTDLRPEGPWDIVAADIEDLATQLT